MALVGLFIPAPTKLLVNAQYAEYFISKSCILRRVFLFIVIHNTIRYGLSNARIEATNNKIKLIIRKAYGFKNIDSLMDMIYLVCSNIKIQLPNRPIPLRTAA